MNDDIGVIAKASYEVHTEMLLNGAKHGLLDSMTGVSSNVMTGQPFLGGTNLCQVHIDLKEMERLNTQSELVSASTTGSTMMEIENTFSDVLEKNKAQEECSQEKIKIVNYLSTIPTVNVDTKINVLSEKYDMGF